MAITARPDKIPNLQVRLLRDHVSQQSIRRDVEWDAEKNVAAALV